MQSIHFNTGRKYSVHGQRISATLHDDGVCTFWDHDRMVDGEIFGVVNFGPGDVLHCYDAGRYSSSTRSWQDGMLRGGCNSVYAG